MTQGESPTLQAIDAAQAQIASALTIGIAEAANSLLNLMRTAATYRQRGQFASTQTQLLQNRGKFIDAFKESLKAKVASELDPKASEHAQEATDWEAVSLVDEDSIEERLSFERIGQLINHECEAELRELSGYMSTLLRHGWADPERNPLRGNIVGYALHQAVESAIDDSEIQRILMREIGQPFAKSLPGCYRAIIEDFEKRGFSNAAEHSPRASHPGGSHPGGAAPAGPSVAMPPPTFEEARALWERSMEGRMPQDAGDTLRSWESSILGRYGRIDPIPEDFDPEGSAALLDRLIRGGMPGSYSSGPPASPGSYGSGPPGPPGAYGGGPPGPPGSGPAPAGRSPASMQADAELMSLLRRLNGGNSGPGRLDSADSGRPPLASEGRDGGPAAARYGYPAGSKPASGGSGSGGVRALMAANLIRAHRDELQQASRGKLDHMVIEVVASLFDQILSDSRVAPQMARQIARLQLPVLRVALKDPNFFSSRRHPVRRFINRVSTLAAGFSAFESGPAKEFLARVTDLVKDIVEGDFDQLDTYNEKLLDLERFIEEQARAEVEATPAAETIKVKELEWKQQQQFSTQLLAALEALAMPAYLKEFISKVWGRVILAVSQRDGEESPNAQRFRKAAFDLVVSIQPKRSIEQRSRFLSTLPGLMATLNEGMKLIDWPEQDNTAFFGKLLAEHAGSLKTAPASELDYNLLLRGVEAAAKTPLPTKEEVETIDIELGDAPAIEPQFSAEEARNLGLIADSAVDWQARIAITPEDIVERAFDTPLPTVPGEPGDAPAADDDSAPAPTEGPQLRDHLELGVSYQLHLKDRWEKVRLTYMSPGRTMFLFKHGSEDRGTISMTSRMLQKLCESRRMRALERSTLVDRATARARQQLTALGNPGASPEQRLAG